MTTPQSVTYYLDSLDENVEEINLSQKGLTVFPDLSRFTNLIKLDCNFNQIKKINKLPKKLEILCCAFNQIEQLNNLPKKLIKLDCSFNKIKELKNLPKKLKELYYTNNQIRECIPDVVMGHLAAFQVEAVQFVINNDGKQS